VQFLGRLPAGKDIFDQFDMADIFVLASRTEGLPRAMVEAMARGLPCIGSNVGGIPELLASEDLVPPGDVETLAVKITSLIRNPDTLMKMMHRNLQAVRNYRADELNWRRIEFYKRVRDGVNTRHTKQNES
jgi:glycosyltransferase involved in cell wall biosynthesis